MFGPKGPFCQSCRMPLSKDALPDMAADQTIEKVRGKMKEMHIPGFLAKSFAKGIPDLQRWNR